MPKTALDELQVRRDRKLAKRMLRGDDRAITEFCNQYIPKLYRFACSRLPNHHDVDDVVQLVVANAARRIETYRGEATLLTWLCQICRREISKHLAARAKHQNVVSLTEDGEAASAVENLPANAMDQPDSVAGRAETISEVQGVLDQLPDHYAQALELKYIDGLSSKEIAAHFEIADDAAQSLLARARRAFRECYGTGSLSGAATAPGGNGA
ncbi:MAG: sigma-70 family RNA polymerase sigma factor [Gammaproteobacteria bacterium]|nr:sigma-70 family RNA polymerase sigma factor [Gammaproteobacteria bacterium]